MNTKIGIKTFLWAGFYFVTSILTSCKDEQSNVGLGLNPNNPSYDMYYNNNTNIKAFTYRKSDTIRINTPTTFLGYMNDPILGKSQYSFMAELNPQKVDDTTFFSDKSEADSIFLNLKSYGFYGNCKDSLEVKMYYLKNSKVLKDIDKTANNDIDFNIDEYYDNQEIFSFKFYPGTTKDTSIRLPSELLSKFEDGFQHLYSGASFRENIIRGFYFESVDPGNNIEGGVRYLNLLKSDITLFFHNLGNSEDQKKFTFAFYPSTDTVYQNTCSYCNIYSHFLEDNILANSIESKTDPDTSVQSEYLYVKDNNSLEIRFHLYDMGNWKDSGTFFINKASIDLYASVDFNSNEDSIYILPTLYASIDTSATITDTIHYISSKLLEIKPQVKNNLIYYPLDMTASLSSIIKEDINNVYINLKTINNGAGRAILYGPNSEKHNPKLNIVYSKLK